MGYTEGRVGSIQSGRSGNFLQEDANGEREKGKPGGCQLKWWLQSTTPVLKEDSEGALLTVMLLVILQIIDR